MLIANSLRSLQSRNYRLWFGAQLVSFCGTYMQVLALAWLVLKLSHDSGGALGLITGLQTAPTLLFGAWAGVVIDRVDTRRLLVMTGLVMAASSGTLAVLTFTHHATLWSVGLLALVGGCGNMLDLPARLTFVHELVGREGLANAVGLNSTMVNGARIVGPAVGGFVLVSAGTGWCFLLNALSFLVVVGCLLLLDHSQLHPSPAVERAAGQTREGLAYMRREPDVRSNLILTAVLGLVAFNYPVILPLLAKLTFGGGPGLYTTLTVVTALGALAASLWIASRSRFTQQQLLVASVAYAVVMALTAVAPTTVLMYPAVALVGAANVVFVIGSNSMLQLTVDPRMRGRALAVRTVTLTGGAALGSPLVGWISQHAGPRWALGLGSLTLVGASAWYAAFLGRTARTGAGATASAAGPAVGHGT